MGLRDTISGAMEEVAGGDSLFARQGEETTAKAATAEEEASGSANVGFTKRSTARAKPRREAAGSVRVVSNEQYREDRDKEENKNLSRAERRAKRERQGSIEDRRSSVSHYILKGHAEYQRSQKIWWGLIGTGICATLLAWGFGQFMASAPMETRVVFSMVMLVVAYGTIIASFIYDWRVVRPMRKAADEEAARMSDKRLRAYLNDEYAREQAARAAGKKPSLWERITGRA